MNSNVYVSKGRNTVLMIGDSITEGFDPKKYYQDVIVINKGVSGDSTVECLERIAADWFLAVPDYIFLCIGTNDLARERTDDYILMNIRKIIKRIRQFSAHSHFYVTSIFPTRANEPRPNERINGLNEQLKELSVKTDCTFFDLHKYFTDENGMLKKEFTDDGLHLIDAGYKKWGEVFSAFLEREMLRT